MNPLTSLYVQQMWMANTTSGDGVIDGVAQHLLLHVHAFSLFLEFLHARMPGV